MNADTTDNNLLPIVEATSYKRAIPIPLTDNIYYSINYPGMVENIDKCISTLGGVGEITKVFKTNQTEYLKCKQRPTSNNCKPAFGDKINSCKMLLRVRKIKNEEKQDEEQQQQVQPVQQHFISDIIAIIPSTIEFNGMNDFQYIHEPYNNISNQNENTNHSYFETSQDRKLNTIPLMFSRIDKPFLYGFKTNPTAIYNAENQQFEIRKATVQNPTAVFIRFQDKKVPTHNNIPLTEEDKKDKQFTKSFEILNGLLQTKPIWSRIAIKDHYCRQGGSLRLYKRLLFTMSYQFTNGPFRHSAIRFGYDPRLSNESRFYQMVTLRLDSADKKLQPMSLERNLPKLLFTPRRPHGPKYANSAVNTGGVNLLDKFSETQSKNQNNINNTIDNKENQDQNNNNNNQDNIIEEHETYFPPYDYTFKTIPPKRTDYQIDELDNEKCKNIKNHIMGLTPESTCKLDLYGWFTKADTESISLRLKIRYDFLVSQEETATIPSLTTDSVDVVDQSVLKDIDTYEAFKFNDADDDDDGDKDKSTTTNEQMEDDEMEENNYEDEDDMDDEDDIFVKIAKEQSLNDFIDYEDDDGGVDDDDDNEDDEDEA